MTGTESQSLTGLVGYKIEGALELIASAGDQLYANLQAQQELAVSIAAFAGVPASYVTVTISSAGRRLRGHRRQLTGRILLLLYQIVFPPEAEILEVTRVLTTLDTATLDEQEQVISQALPAYTVEVLSVRAPPKLELIGVEGDTPSALPPVVVQLPGKQEPEARVDAIDEGPITEGSSIAIVMGTIFGATFVGCCCITWTRWYRRRGALQEASAKGAQNGVPPAPEVKSKDDHEKEKVVVFCHEPVLDVHPRGGKPLARLSTPKMSVLFPDDDIDDDDSFLADLGLVALESGFPAAIGESPRRAPSRRPQGVEPEPEPARPPQTAQGQEPPRPALPDAPEMDDCLLPDGPNLCLNDEPAVAEDRRLSTRPVRHAAPAPRASWASTTQVAEDRRLSTRLVQHAAPAPRASWASTTQMPAMLEPSNPGLLPPMPASPPLAPAQSDIGAASWVRAQPPLRPMLPDAPSMDDPWLDEPESPVGSIGGLVEEAAFRPSIVSSGNRPLAPREELYNPEPAARPLFDSLQDAPLAPRGQQGQSTPLPRRVPREQSAAPTAPPPQPGLPDVPEFNLEQDLELDLPGPLDRNWPFREEWPSSETSTSKTPGVPHPEELWLR